MALYDTKSQITFKNLSVSYANTQLVGDIEQQITRLDLADARRKAFRSDLMMLGEGDLWGDQSLIESRDLLVVAGMLNYVQGIVHRMMTPRGYHPADASFGVPWFSYLGATYSRRASVEAQLIADISEELLKDSRTGSVASVSVNFESPTLISVECKIVPLNINDDIITLSFSAGV